MSAPATRRTATDELGRIREPPRVIPPLSEQVAAD
jgi:hypothetical protein